MHLQFSNKTAIYYEFVNLKKWLISGIKKICKFVADKKLFEKFIR